MELTENEIIRISKWYHLVASEGFASDADTELHLRILNYEVDKGHTPQNL
jgi:hypothetical protein